MNSDIDDRSGEKKERLFRMLPWAVTVLACGLYLPFLSIQVNPNGLNEAIGVEHGGAALFSPNHMLYRPLGWLIWTMAGATGKSISILQAMSGVFGVVAACGMALATSAMTRSSAAAACGALWIMTSCYFWASCTDAFYIAPAVAFVTLAMAVVARSRRWSFGPVLVGVLTALAILMWQAAILVVPAFIVALACDEQRDRVARIRSVLVFLLISGVSTFMVYLLVGIRFFGVTSLGGLFEWFTSYGGARLPMWGAWSLDRLGPLLNSVASSFAPLRDIGGVPGLWRRVAQKPELVALNWIAILSHGVLFILAIAGSLKRAVREHDWFRFWPLVGYGAFLPFLLWWDPFEPKWMVVPNAFLAIALAQALGAGKLPRKSAIAVLILIVVAAGACFWSTILPRRTSLAARQRQANCIGSHMSEGDLFVATDWKWNAYLSYFHAVRIESFIGQARPGQPVDPVMASVAQRIRETRESGGRCIMVDPNSYHPKHLAWLERQTGLTAKDLSRVVGEPAFQCGPFSFLDVEEIR